MFILGICALCVALEVPVVAALYPGERLRMGLACALATAATNLFMNGLLPGLLASASAVLLIGEAMALVVEALVYFRVSKGRDWARALVASSLANASSYLVGMGILALIRG